LEKSDQVLKGFRPLRSGFQVGAVMASLYVSIGHLRVSAEGVVNR
jgi:hypothetical protein